MNDFYELPEETELFTVAEITRKLFSLFSLLGIPANLRGFKYLCDAVCEVYYDPSVGDGVVKGLYCRVAQKNGTTYQCVEHSIRTALERLERPGNKAKYFEFVGKEAGYTAKKFINAVADRLRAECLTKKQGAQA